MFSVTLLCNPQLPVLDGPIVTALRRSWQGSDERWLCPGVAAEFLVALPPPSRAQDWQRLQEQGIDMLVQPANGRRKALLIADMDSTMIRQECIDELADVAGVGHEVSAITAAAMNGQIDFETALTERVALLKGQPAELVAQVLRERITLTPGGPALVATMKANGAHTALVSGGFTDFTDVIAARLGFDEARANVLLAAGGVLSGQVARPILGKAAKVQALQEIAARMGIKQGQVLAVGDGANDLGMLGLAGTGVALHAKPSVQAQCEHRVNHGDLTALLYLQGYAQSEFTE